MGGLCCAMFKKSAAVVICFSLLAKTVVGGAADVFIDEKVKEQARKWQSEGKRISEKDVRRIVYKYCLIRLKDHFKLSDFLKVSSYSTYAQMLEGFKNFYNISEKELYEFVRELFGQKGGTDYSSTKRTLSNDQVQRIIQENAVDESSWCRFFYSILPFTSYYRKSMPEVREKLGDDLYIQHLDDLYVGNRWRYNRVAESSKVLKDYWEFSRNSNKRLAMQFKELGLYFAESTEEKRAIQDACANTIGSIDTEAYFSRFSEHFSDFLSPTTEKNVGYAMLAFAVILCSTFSSKVKEAVIAIKDTLSYPVRKFLFKAFDRSNWRKEVEGLRQYLLENMIGQRKVINKFISGLAAYYSNKEKAEVLGIPFDRGLFFYAIGNPGCGKTLMVDLVNKYFGRDFQVFGIDDVLEDRGNNAVTIRDRLLKPCVKDYGYKKVEVNSRLADVLSFRKPTFFCFDEVDKMRYWEWGRQGIDYIERKKKGIKLSGSTFDELMRLYVDGGKIADVQTKDSVVFVNSNEKYADVKALESSLFNRYEANLLEFEDFTLEDYVQFAVKALNDLLAKYYKERNVQLVWDETDLRFYAEYLSKMECSGRMVSIFVDRFTPIVDDFYEKHEGIKRMVLHWDREKKKIHVTG